MNICMINESFVFQVYLTIVGDRDVLHKTKLWRRQGTTNFCFVRGSKEVFHVKGPKLGNLTMVTLQVGCLVCKL